MSRLLFSETVFPLNLFRPGGSGPPSTFWCDRVFPPAFSKAQPVGHVGLAAPLERRPCRQAGLDIPAHKFKVVVFHLLQIRFAEADCEALARV